MNNERIGNYRGLAPKSVCIATIVPIILIVLFTVACGTALRVSHGVKKPVEVPGIPFYAKKARCRQEIIWFEPIYNLSLAALLPDKDGALQAHPRGAVALSRSDFESSEVTDFLKLINNQPSDENTVITGWKKIATHSDSHILSRQFDSISTKDLILAGRSAAPLIYVDYSDQYYVNAKLPWAGSANVDAKVSEDGSLSEASGQVETKTVETILSALPISSLITGGLGLGGKSIADLGKVEAFQLTLSISGYKHTLARLVDFPSDSPPVPCSIASNITLSKATEYKREDIAASPAKDGDSKDQSNKKPDDSSDAGKGAKKP